MEAQAREAIPRLIPSIKERPAIETDLPEVVSVGTRLFAESCFNGLTIDVESGRDHLARLIERGQVGIARLSETDMLVGFISFEIVRRYTVEPLAYLDLLYVLPEYRFSPAGWLLMKGALDVAEDKGARMFFMGLGSGFKDDGRSDGRLRNLCHKLGFSDLGPSMRKVLHD